MDFSLESLLGMLGLGGGNQNATAANPYNAAMTAQPVAYAPPAAAPASQPAAAAPPPPTSENVSASMAPVSPKYSNSGLIAKMMGVDEDMFRQSSLSDKLLGLGAGLGKLGPSRLPVPFAQSLASGAQGLLDASQGFTKEVLQAAQVGTAVSESDYKKMQTKQLAQDMELLKIQLAAAIKKRDQMAGGPDTGATPVKLTEGPIAGTEEPAAAAAAPAPAPTKGGAPTPEMSALIQKAAADQNVPPHVLTGLLGVESNFKPGVTSPAGAQGLGQLMPGTAKELGVSNPFDITQAIPAAAKYLRQGLDAHGGDMNKALMYYHGGPNTKIWGPKTQAYPGAVLSRANQFASLSEPPATSGSSTPPAAAPSGPDYTGVNVLGPIPKPGSGLPVMSSQFVFGTPTPPPNAGHIVPPAIPNAGVPGPGQSLMNMIGGRPTAAPPGYQPPSPLAGAAAAIPGPPPGTPAVLAQGAPAGAPLAAPRPPMQMAQAQAVPQSAPPQGVPQRAPAAPPTAAPTLLNGGQVLPSGYTRQDVADATFNATIARLRKQTPDATDVKLSTYSLDVALERDKANAQEAAKAAHAYQIENEKRRAEADNAQRLEREKRLGEDKMIKVPFQNGSIEMPRSQYENLRKQRPDLFPDYGLLPGAPGATGTPSAGIRPPAAGALGPSGQALPGAAIGEPNAITIDRDKTRQETDPFAFHFKPTVGQGPGQTEPIVKMPAPDHPSYSVIPPVSEFNGVQGSKTSITEAQKKWSEIDSNFTPKTLGELQKSQQIINTMADAFSRFHPGAFAEWQADVNKKLGTVGLQIPFTNNKAQDSEILKQYAFQNAIASLKGMGQMSNMELQGATMAWANPNLEPATAYSVLANDMGKLKQAEAFIQDRGEAKKHGWIDPEAFYTKWHSRPENSLKNFVDRAKATLPPFKGMTEESWNTVKPPQTMTHEGKRYIAQDGEWRPL